MKKLLFIFIAAFSLNLMAKTTTLGCTDQKTEAVYILRISEDLSIIALSSFTKDSSVLSKSMAVLDLKKDRSSATQYLYAGINSKKNIIIAELKHKQLINDKRTKINIYFSEDDSNINQETVFDCSVHIDERYKKSEKATKSKIFKFKY